MEDNYEKAIERGENLELLEKKAGIQ